MPRSLASRRYARALFELAQEQGRLDAVHNDVKELARLATRRKELSALLEPYELKAADRKGIWDQILKDKVDPLTHRFVHFLVDKRRIGLLSQITHDFAELYKEAMNITTLEIRAAHPLTETQIHALSDRFAAKLGRTIAAIQTTDPSLLGGFQVHAGDVVYDYSVNHQLEILHQKLTTV